MTTARTVSVTTEMDGNKLDAEDSWHLARRHGLGTVLVGAFIRFRYGVAGTRVGRHRGAAHGRGGGVVGVHHLSLSRAACSTLTMAPHPLL